MRRTFLLLFTACLLLMATPVQGQDYGTGVTIDVAEVQSTAMTLDGFANEAVWDNAEELDLTQFWNGSFSDTPDPDVSATGRVLFTEDTLYVFAEIADYQPFYWGSDGNPWQGEAILVGIDATHAGDDQVDESYAGWPANAPDQGPVTYKVNRDGITLDWGYSGIDPIAEGWVRGTVVVDEENFVWSVEMAIYAPQIDPEAQIGFNIGGSTASEEYAAESDEGDGNYAYFSWQAVDAGSAGGDVMNNAASFATLNLVPRATGGGDGYGIGVEEMVPEIDPGALTLDGSDDEAAWDDALEVDLTQYWNGAYSGTPDPDVGATAKVLYAPDTLYVYAQMEDYQPFYWGTEGNPWQGEQLIVGVDPTHAGDDQIDDSYGGWTANAPDFGPTAYKININGITSNWGFDGIDPVAEGWVRGEVFVDEDNFTWGVEMAIYVGSSPEIGFNIGGATASQEYADENDGDGGYAYFSWQAIASGSAGGDVMNNAGSYATLVVGMSTSVEESPLGEVPGDFALAQNYPNPFNPTTTIEYGLQRAGQVTLTVYNALGQEVETLVSGMRTAGTYRAQWQAANLPSGIYLYRLQVDGAVVAMKKMMLIK